MEYLRARYYSSQAGRFLTRDSWTGDPYQPMSYNGWNYTDSNPINRTDPTGQCFTNMNPASPGFQFRYWEYPILGLCVDHSHDLISQNNSNHHDYSTDNIVCPWYFNCSSQEMGDAMIRFDYPGQDSSKPVHNNDTATVWPFNAWFLKGTSYEALGAILIGVSKDHLTTKNATASTHIFFKGVVD